MRAVLLVIVFVALVLAKPVADATVTNWSISASGNNQLKIWFQYQADCKAAYGVLATSGSCNPGTFCTASSPYLSLANCSASETLSSAFAFQMLSDSGNCYMNVNGSFCIEQANLTFAYSSKVNCISDYLTLTGSSYCQISANCGATAPTIDVSNVQTQFYMCTLSPALNLTATTISFSS